MLELYWTSLKKKKKEEEEERKRERNLTHFQVIFISNLITVLFFKVESLVIFLIF